MRGVSLMEMLAALLILSFIVAATATLFNTGQRQQRLGRAFSQAQTDIRVALRDAMRAIRHGTVVNPSTNFGGNAPSNSSQVIVNVPEPTGAATSYIELRYYLSSGTLYKQRSDQNAGSAILTGVDSLTINYFKTVYSSRTSVDANPETATEVLITVTVIRERITTRVSTLIALRPFTIGL